MKFNLDTQEHPGYLPEGIHRVWITEAAESEAKSSGNSQLVLALEAVDGVHAGKIARSWITLTDSARQFHSYFAKAVFPDAAASVEFEPEQLVGKEVRIKVDRPEHEEYPQVARYYPV
jgi:hypothetical protein